MIIDAIKSDKIFRHRLVIDFQYQSINWHRLLSIDIDYHRLSVSSIDHAGKKRRARWLSEKKRALGTRMGQYRTGRREALGTRFIVLRWYVT